MFLGILKISILVIPIFLGIGFGAYADYINAKNKKRVAEATTNKK